MSQQSYPGGELQLMRVYKNDLILMGACRNIAIFDLLLNMPVVRTQYVVKCSPFVQCCLLNR